MRRTLISLMLLALASPAVATDYTVSLTGTTANQDAALVRLYTDACNDRLDAGQAALPGCTTGGSPVRCTCTPSQAQLESAMATLLRNTLTNKYQNMLDAEAKIIRQQYPNLTPTQQADMRTICGAACGF